MFKKILLSLFAILGLTLSLGSQGAFESRGNFFSGEDKQVTLSYVQWDSEIASTYVLAAILEEAGYQVQLTPVDVAINFSAIANGEADATVSVWLPNTHGEYLKRYGDQMVDLGHNLEGATIGLTVPAYMDVDSISDLKDQAGKKITAIEPGAGVVVAAQEAQGTYSNLSDWEVVTASTGAMTTALGQAIDKEEDIVVTGWTPHWMFAQYDLKYLEDSEGVFGEGEYIATYARQGLEEDSPGAFKIIDAFRWQVEDMESVMLDISQGGSPEEAAQTWVQANRDRVDDWIQE